MTVYVLPIYQNRNKNSIILSQDALMPLNALNNLSEQMIQLMKLLEIPPEEYSERREVCRKLTQHLRKFYPDGVLLMFGSSINSFGLKGCNLDLLFLPFPNYCNLDYTASNVPIPDPASVLTGEVPKSVLMKLDELSHLKFIKTVLQEEKVGTKVNYIPSHSPCLNLQLSNSKIMCDISVSNELVLFSSELLQLYEKADVRVKPLVVCLRFWAKSLGFIRKSFFSSYAFTLLIVFFLQSINPPILPSILYLILHAGFCRRIDGWQTAFPIDMNVLPGTENTETVGELLLHFFNYYLHFDFLQNVVSPHYGKVLTIEDLKTDKRLLKFEFTSLNIQDMFILSRNVCKVKNLTIFKLAVLTAYKMLKNNEKLQFNLIFDPKEYQRVLDIHYFELIPERPTVIFINLHYEYVRKFKYLQSLYDNVCNTVYEVLQYGLLMECEVIDKVHTSKNKSKLVLNSVNKDVGKGSILNNTQLSKNSFNNNIPLSYDLQLLLSLQCVVYSKTWIGRKKAVVIKQEEQDELEVFSDSALSTEYYISKSLIDSNPSLSSPVPLLVFTCDCYKHVSPEISDVIVILKPCKPSKDFLNISKFLVSFISNTVHKILNPC